MLFFFLKWLIKESVQKKRDFFIIQSCLNLKFLNSIMFMIAVINKFDLSFYLNLMDFLCEFVFMWKFEVTSPFLRNIVLFVDKNKTKRKV